MGLTRGDYHIKFVPECRPVALEPRANTIILNKNNKLIHCSFFEADIQRKQKESSRMFQSDLF